MLTSVQENFILYSMTNTTDTKYSEFVNLTEMWQDSKYLEVGELIFNEKWSHSRLAEFCSYIAKHLGVNQLNLWDKFL